MADPSSAIADRVVPMRVIVCGVHRTGTMSMRTALMQLGFHDCYHMVTVLDNLDSHPQQWQRALEAKYASKGTFGRKDFDKLLGRSQACVDIPAALFGAELADLYPDAKVVILNRDPEKWYESALQTVHDATRYDSLGAALRLGFCYAFDPATRSWTGFMRSMVALAMPFNFAREKGAAIAWFNGQYKEFRDRVPADRRLEFCVQDGWEPLCEYLGVPVPMVKDGKTGRMVKAPFPRVNDRETFRRNAAKRRDMALARARENMFKVVGKLAAVLAVGYAGYLVWKTTAW